MIADAAVTGAGDLPGTSSDEAMRIVAGELGSAPHLPFLPVLAERGPGADAVGRTAALLSAVSPHFAVTTIPRGWRLAGADTREMRRARAWLGEDLDRAEEQLAGLNRSVVLPVVGPLTLAALLELQTGHRMVRDHGAVRDLAQALGEAVAVHIDDVRRRIPGASPLARLDEARLSDVLAGGISTPSGLDRYRAVGGQQAGELIAAVVRSAGDSDVALRCGGNAPPLDVMAASGASVLSVDLSGLDLRRDGDAMGTALDGGTVVLLGVEVTGHGESETDATVGAVTRWWTDLGFDPEKLPASVGLQPAATSVAPVRQFEVLRSVSARLREASDMRGDHDG